MLYLIDSYEHLFEPHLDIERVVASLLELPGIPEFYHNTYQTYCDDFKLLYGSFEDYLLVDCVNKKHLVDKTTIDLYTELFAELAQDLADLCFQLQAFVCQLGSDDEILATWVIEDDDE